jgi:hypothetical protein
VGIKTAPIIVLLSTSICFTGCNTEKHLQLNGFSIGGQPVHPGCVYSLLTDLADKRPTTASVDVVGCRESNSFVGEISVLQDGIVAYKDARLLGKDGRFTYQWLGTTDNGVQVLQTELNTGGSGIFISVLLARLVKEPFFNDGIKKERIVLRGLGEIVLGDRSSTQVEVSGQSIILKENEARERIIQVDKEL